MAHRASTRSLQSWWSLATREACSQVRFRAWSSASAVLLQVDLGRPLYIKTCLIFNWPVFDWNTFTIKYGSAHIKKRNSSRKWNNRFIMSSPEVMKGIKDPYQIITLCMLILYCFDHILHYRGSDNKILQNRMWTICFRPVYMKLVQLSYVVTKYEYIPVPSCSSVFVYMIIPAQNLLGTRTSHISLSLPWSLYRCAVWNHIILPVIGTCTDTSFHIVLNQV